ncbi:MAG: hypothetical protein ABI895_14310 [Deltaproteobacteria bacterium]
MTRSRTTSDPASQYSEAWLPAALTERLLDVLLDSRGIRAAFIVNELGELLAARFSPAHSDRDGFAAALEAAAGLRAAASSGFEPTTALVEFSLGLLFVRHFRRSYLCVWATQPLPQRSLELSSRLVAASLPPDARMEATAAPEWDEDDQRPTEPCLPQGEGWLGQSPEVSLRPPRIPRELRADTSSGPPREPQRWRELSGSGMRPIAAAGQLLKQRAQRPG